jgi:uncharacterized protein YkwD
VLLLLGVAISGAIWWKLASKDTAVAQGDGNASQPAVAVVTKDTVTHRETTPPNKATRPAEETKVEKSPSTQKAPPPEKPPVLSAEEEELLRLVNKARAEDGKQLPPLTPNAKLFEVARAKAASLAKVKTLTPDLDGKPLAERVVEVGYKPVKSKVAANLVAHKDLSAQQALAAWLEDPTTRQLLLDAYQETGIGVVRGEQGEVFYCQIYAMPEK